MAASGAPASGGKQDGWAKGLNVAVIAASWHQVVMDGLIAGATRTLDHAGAAWQLFRVPGSFELPVATAHVLNNHGSLTNLPRAGFDAAVALGVVIRGGTPHFDYVCQAAAEGLTRVAIDARRPVGFGLLTCDDEAQAIDRAGLPGSSEDKGAEAAAAALETALMMRQIYLI